eukprot:7193301-Prymnesium_polylepis.2
MQDKPAPAALPFLATLVHRVMVVFSMVGPARSLVTDDPPVKQSAPPSHAVSLSRSALPSTEQSVMVLLLMSTWLSTRCPRLSASSAYNAPPCDGASAPLAEQLNMLQTSSVTLAPKAASAPPARLALQLSTRTPFSTIMLPGSAFSPAPELARPPVSRTRSSCRWP